MCSSSRNFVLRSGSQHTVWARSTERSENLFGVKGVIYMYIYIYIYKYTHTYMGWEYVLAAPTMLELVSMHAHNWSCLTWRRMCGPATWCPYGHVTNKSMVIGQPRSPASMMSVRHRVCQMWPCFYTHTILGHYWFCEFDLDWQCGRVCQIELCFYKTKQQKLDIIVFVNLIWTDSTVESAKWDHVSTKQNKKLDIIVFVNLI